ncbi:unnamed protein product [Prorocentrum cordatum]|uniref:Uncharacterized protein n=1 Tax=Prorocentrum cordatum TaxID=2364126 RepID=A0ABN9XNN2_9DINO|nr:unnamed protein product [Polarella glacialis]
MEAGAARGARGADASLLGGLATGAPTLAARGGAGGRPGDVVPDEPRAGRGEGLPGGAWPAPEGPEDLGWGPTVRAERGRARDVETCSQTAGVRHCAILGYSKGQRDAAFSRRTFSLDFWLACAAASWTVALSLPVLVWPWGDALAGSGFRMAGFGSTSEYLYSVYWNLGSTMKLTIQGVLGTLTSPRPLPT